MDISRLVRGSANVGVKDDGDGGISIQTTNAPFERQSNIFELTTLATGSTTTNTTANLAKANSNIKAILVKIATTITTAANFNVRITGGNAFVILGTATSSLATLTAGTKYILVPAAHADAYNKDDTTLTYTTNVNPGAGALSVTVIYETFFLT